MPTICELTRVGCHGPHVSYLMHYRRHVVFAGYGHVAGDNGRGREGHTLQRVGAQLRSELHAEQIITFVYWCASGPEPQRFNKRQNYSQARPRGKGLAAWSAVMLEPQQPLAASVPASEHSASSQRPLNRTRVRVRHNAMPRRGPSQTLSYTLKLTLTLTLIRTLTTLTLTGKAHVSSSSCLTCSSLRAMMQNRDAVPAPSEWPTTLSRQPGRSSSSRDSCSASCSSSHCAHCNEAQCA